MNTINWIASKRKLSELKELPENPRRITESAFAKLKERIEKRGFHDVLKLDTEDYILSGNQRSKVLKELGVVEVNVLTPDRALSKKERDSVLLESNRNDGTFDFDMIGNQYDEMDLKDLGFTDLELGLTSFEVTEKDNSSSGETEKIECPHCHKTFER